MKFYNVMKHSLAVVVFSLLLALPLAAQQQENLTTEQKERKMYEYIDSETERLTGLLKLDEGQQYYVTMTLTDCLTKYNAELEELGKAGVQNMDLYQMVADKWMDEIDRQYESYFTPEQWKKYLRSGAERARKAREKRREKAQRAAGVTEN